MFKIYFRQAIQMLKQNKFISVISILGTALAIMMIMTIIVTEQASNVNMAPEDKRDRTLYVGLETRRDTLKSSQNSGPLRKDLITDYFSKLKTPEAIAIVNCAYMGFQPNAVINREGSKETVETVLRNTNDGYWQVYSFDFTAGGPFSREEFDSGMPVAVISESTARKLFRRDESPVGKTILIDFNPYRITGVVKDVSQIFRKAFGEVWVPYTALSADMFEVSLLARSTDDFPAITAEVKDIQKQFAIVNPHYVLTLPGPMIHKHYATGVWAWSDEDLLNSTK